MTEFANRPALCISSGWLVAKTRSYVTLAADYSPANGPEEIDDWSRVTKIPKKMIVTIEPIPLPDDKPIEPIVAKPEG